jgi:RecB family exonuclease
MPEIKSDNQKKLPKYSYSRLDLFLSCPMKYKLQYIDKNYTEETTLVLEIGNLLHKIKEIKYRDSLSFDELYKITHDGIKETTDKDKNKMILGITDLKKKYGEQKFKIKDEKLGVSYNDKIGIFFDDLKNEKLEDGWKVITTEQKFNFTYKDRCIFEGFIDRVDQHEDGRIRVIDYKSSSKLYDSKDLPTPMQMFIYSLAIENRFGKPLEIGEAIYDMILLGEKQHALTKGYYDRGIKKLDKTLDDLEWCITTNDWTPKPTPLCYWCNFSGNTCCTDWTLAGMCQYFSLWKPDSKCFAVNKEYKK